MIKQFFMLNSKVNNLFGHLVSQSLQARWSMNRFRNPSIVVDEFSHVNSRVVLKPA